MIREHESAWFSFDLRHALDICAAFSFANSRAISDAISEHQMVDWQQAKALSATAPCN